MFDSFFYPSMFIYTYFFHLPGTDFEMLAQLARVPDVSTALSYISCGCFAVGLWGVRLLYKAHCMEKIYRAADLDVLAGRAANRDAARLNRFMLAQHKILHRRAMFLFAIGPMSMAVYFVKRPEIFRKA